MIPDGLLLRHYAMEAKSAAFTELVHRHLNLVYGAAMRRTGGDAHLSADICQHVFISLARNARSLITHPCLSAWLHTATRNAALNVLTSEQRRKTREATAMLTLADNESEDAPEWHQLKPLLDETIDELSEADRTVIVGRFLEGRAFAEIGAHLKVSEDAARMRTERALERMRAALARRGIRSTASALGTVLIAQPAMTAPAGLAASITNAAVHLGGAAAFTAAVFTFMTPKLITTALASACVAFGAGLYVSSLRTASEPVRSASTATRLEQDAFAKLRSDNQQLQAEVSRLTGELGRLVEENTRLSALAKAPAATVSNASTSTMSPAEIQQAVLNNLRQVAAARDQYVLENGRPPGSITDLVGTNSYIRRLRSVAGESYANISTDRRSPLTVTTSDGLVITYDPEGNRTTQVAMSPEALERKKVEQRVQNSVNKAVQAFRAANQGNNPPNEQALIPYFTTTEDGADFVEFMEARKKDIESRAANRRSAP